MIYLVTKQEAFPNSNTLKIISVNEALTLLSPLKIVGIDTETSGLTPHKDELLSVQLGCFDFQIVIDCTTIDIREFSSYLSSNRLFVFWNAKFDLKWLFKYKIVPVNVYDGYLAEKLMFLGYPPGFHSMSLKTAGIDYLGIELDKSVRRQIINKGFSSVDTIVYAANDVKYLEKIMMCQQVKLKEKALLTALRYENAFVLPLAYMEFCGVKIDIDKWKAKMNKDQERFDKAKKALDDWLITNNPKSSYVYVDYQGDLFSGFDTSPKVSLNWNSTQQVVSLFKEYGINVETKDKAKGGIKDSIDAKILKPQKNKCPLIPLYLDYREAQKVTSTYGENFLNQIDENTGRLYTNYSQLGADTTRITSGGKDKGNDVEYINLLNLPSDEETRACFVAEKGNRWISIDYSGQETYLLASIANDEAVIKELTEGSGDIHSLTAYMSYKEIPRNTPIKEIKKKYHNLRQDAKGIEFKYFSYIHISI